MKTKAFILSAAAALVALSHPTAEACTGITLKAKDGAHIVARTMRERPQQPVCGRAARLHTTVLRPGRRERHDVHRTIWLRGAGSRAAGICCRGHQ